MEISIESTAAKAALELDAKGKQVLKAASKAHRAASRVLFEEDRKQVNVIYARPIPRSGMKSKKTGKMLKRGTGKPRWKRTGMLRRGETLSFSDMFTSIVANTNDTPYAVARHQLGVTSSVIGGLRGFVPKNPAGGIIRKNTWRTDTVEKAGPAAVKKFEEVFASEMNK